MRVRSIVFAWIFAVTGALAALSLLLLSDDKWAYALAIFLVPASVLLLLMAAGAAMVSTATGLAAWIRTGAACPWILGLGIVLGALAFWGHQVYGTAFERQATIFFWSLELLAFVLVLVTWLGLLVSIWRR